MNRSDFNKAEMTRNFRRCLEKMFNFQAKISLQRIISLKTLSIVDTQTTTKLNGLPIWQPLRQMVERNQHELVLSINWSHEPECDFVFPSICKFSPLTQSNCSYRKRSEMFLAPCPANFNSSTFPKGEKNT